MRALTLTQPWASLVAVGAKRIETRSWSTSYRGPLAIHAAKGLGPVGGKDGLWRLATSEPFRSALKQGGLNPARLPLGAVLAVVQLAGVVPAVAKEAWDTDPLVMVHHTEEARERERAFGNYEPGRYAWLLNHPILRPPEPVHIRGSLQLWYLPPDIEAETADWRFQ